MADDVEKLVKQLRGGWFGSPETRAAAAKRLGECRDSRAVEPLIAALNDPDGAVRAQAAWALGELRDARAMAPLVRALQDSHRGVYHQAGQALLQVFEQVLARPQDLDTVLRIGERAAEFSAGEEFRESAGSVMRAAYGSVLPFRPELSLTLTPPERLLEGAYSSWKLRVVNGGRMEARGVELDVEGPWERTGGALGDLRAGQTGEWLLSLRPTAAGEAVPLQLALSYQWLPVWCVALDPPPFGVSWRNQYAVEPAPKEGPAPIVYQAGGDIILPGAAKQQVQEGVAVVKSGSQTGSPQGAPARFCPYCRHELNLPKQPRFCPSCGEKLADDGLP